MAEKRPKKKRKISRKLFSDSGRSVSFHSDGSEKAAEEIKEILASVAPSGQYPSNPSLRVISDDNNNTYFTPIRTVTFGGKRNTRRKKRRRKRKTKRKKRRRKRKTKKRRK